MASKRPSVRLPAEAKLRRITEILAVVVLSVSALGSSYAGFQEGLWDSQQAAHYSMAAASQTAATKEETLARQRESVNAMHFTQWLNAYAAGNAELAGFYRDRFEPAFRSAFDKWIASRPRLNPSSPPTPFDISGYWDRKLSRSRQLDDQSQRFFRAAERDTHISDRYGRSVVIFALALFLAGMVQGFDGSRLRLTLVLFGVAAWLLGLVTLVQLPAIRLI